MIMNQDTGDVADFDRGSFASPTRQGQEVRRHPRQDNSDVHCLLRHFESVGCSLTPRFLGIADDGAERLSFLPGSTGYPPLTEPLRSDDALQSVARAIRAVHDASVEFVASATAQWHSYDLAAPADNALSEIDCIGHHDLAAWNIVFDGTDVVGIIDWDAAGPSNRIWDLGYAVHQFVPFHPDADLAGWGWPTVPDRRRRLKLFAEAYGDLDPADLVDAAVMRLISIGAFIDRAVRRGDPDFRLHGEQGHAAGYRRAAAAVIAMRESLL